MTILIHCRLCFESEEYGPSFRPGGRLDYELSFKEVLELNHWSSRLRHKWLWLRRAKLECWRTGVLEAWSSEVLEYWNIGAAVLAINGFGYAALNWSSGVLE